MKTKGRVGAKVIAFIVEFRSGNSYLPNGLIAALSVWCLALIAVLVIAPTEYKGVAPLLVERYPDSQSKDTDQEERDVAVRVSSMEKRGALREADNALQTSTVQERIAANILVRSGYLHSARVIIHRSLNPPKVEYKAVLNMDVENCAQFEPRDDPADFGNAGLRLPRALLAKTEALVVHATQNDPKSGSHEAASREEEEEAAQELRNAARNLAIAAIAVEKFHRNPLQRKFEWFYARAFLALFGTLPDLSLGPAQIRVSRFRETVADFGELQPSDAAAADLLMDECQSLQLAVILMRQFLVNAAESVALCTASEKQKNCSSKEEVASAAYAGQRRRTHAIVDYGPIVASMANMIGQGE